jgi:hypothetical protein
MRKSIAGLAILFLLLVLGCNKQAEVAALNVNDIGGDPAAFVGSITITGITAGYAAQDPSLFGLMDRKELQCQSPNCNKVIIPIRFQGQRPAIGDELLVTGSFQNTGRGYLFTAETVKVVRNHKLGGNGG